jgi:UDP-glucose 4-epimerase
MKYVLVTGANGFIGQHLCQSLLSSGLKLKKHVRTKNSLDACEQYECDLESNEFSEKALENIDVIYHLAGLAHDTNGLSFSEDQYRSINIDATLRIATIAAKQKVKHFIFVSSVKAGGKPIGGSCINEDKQSDPKGIYAITKREAEIKLIELGRLSDMCISIVRPSLVYGPNVGGNLKLMLSSIDNGWFPPIPDTGNQRSMIHVDDLVQALLFVMNNKDAYGEIFIATDGVPHSSRELYEEMCKLLGKKIPSWSIPMFFFNILAKMSLNMKHKVSKLLDDECYSSEKLESIGFKAKRTLGDMNETNF